MARYKEKIKILKLGNFYSKHYPTNRYNDVYELYINNKKIKGKWQLIGGNKRNQTLKYKLIKGV